MFVHYRTFGFILKKIDRGETDQLLTIYTKDFGKLEIFAKAIRKISSKLRAGAEIFNLSEIEFIQGKAHKTLTDAILIEKFENLRKDLKRLRTAYKIAGLLDNLLSGQEKDEAIWGLLTESFNKLNTKYRVQDARYKIYYYFFWNFLSTLGYRPELYNCALCQKKLSSYSGRYAARYIEHLTHYSGGYAARYIERLAHYKLFFSPKEGGAICNLCKKSVKSTKEISPEVIKILRILIKKDWPTLNRLKIEVNDLKLLGTISDYFISEITQILGNTQKE